MWAIGPLFVGEMMEGAFDPYRKWLGILPKDQPPQHYRLLGVELFESDLDVIANAVDARMAHVKTFQAGPYGQLSQRLLNEIAAAKVCLLNPTKKAEYDRALKERLGGRRESPNIVPRIESTSTRRAGKSRRPLAPVLAIGLVVVIVGLVFVLKVSGPDKPIVTKPSVIDSKDVLVSSKPESSRPKKEKEPKVAKDERERKEKEITRVAKIDSPPFKEPKSKSKPSVVQVAVEPPKSVATKVEQPVAVLVGDGRLAVPSGDDQKAAERRIRDIFADEFARASKPSQKLALATELLEQGKKTKDNAADRYVLLRLARDLAAESGEPVKSLAMVDVIGKSYKIDAFRMKFDTLNDLFKLVRRDAQNVLRKIVQVALQLSSDAVKADQLDVASRFAKLSLRAAKKTKDAQLTRERTAQMRTVDRLRLKYVQVKKATETLATDPKDGEANLIVGEWYCCEKDDWEKGLLFLAKCNDAVIAAIAKDDVSTPKVPKKQVSLADKWWDLSEKKGPLAEEKLRSRAKYWYRRALPKLSGLEKVKIEKRLESHVSGGATSRRVAKGVVVPGNVALASNGTKVTGQIKQPSNLLDGVSPIKHDFRTGRAHGVCPYKWRVEFKETYRLQEIRFLLYDKEPRFYHYAVLVSEDGKSFTMLADRSKQRCAGGWQRIRFSPRPVKEIEFISIYNSANKSLSVIEFEAYCIPPRKQLK